MVRSGYVASAWAALALGAVVSGANVVVDSVGNIMADTVVRREISKHQEKSHDGSVIKQNDPTVALARSDLTYNYVDEKLPAACDSHFEYMGLLSNDQCAEACYNSYGCTRFSAGGCALGCRISKTGVNNPNNVAAEHDGQCITTAMGDAGACVVYALAFFHVLEEPASCETHYELLPEAKSRAACAHACKNTLGCKHFTGPEPNCMQGCRISKCNSNSQNSMCPEDEQCTKGAQSGCAAYELFR